MNRRKQNSLQRSAGGGGNHGHEAYLHIAVGHDRANNSAQRCEIHRQHQCRRTDKDGNVTIRIAIADEYGDEYDWQEFSLPTQR